MLTTKKDVLAMIRKITAEEPVICADEADLRKLFDDTDFAMLYHGETGTERVRWWIEKSLRWFTAQFHKPNAIYFKLVTSEDVTLETLRELQTAAEAASGAECVFAFDYQESISAGKCYIELLVG